MVEENQHEREAFVLHLKSKVAEYTAMLEDLFGPRDPNFVFRTICRARESHGDVPRLHFPVGYHTNGQCRVNIHVSLAVWDERRRSQGAWQVAHECVHLLDPSASGASNYLEEGVARWFQDEPQTHSEDEGAQRCAAFNASREDPSSPYAEAKHLVTSRIPQLIPIIKELRVVDNVRIGQITEDMLVSKMTHVDLAAIKKLCSDFPLV